MKKSETSSFIKFAIKKARLLGIILVLFCLILMGINYIFIKFSKTYFPELFSFAPILIIPSLWLVITGKIHKSETKSSPIWWFIGFFMFAVSGFGMAYYISTLGEEFYNKPPDIVFTPVVKKNFAEARAGFKTSIFASQLPSEQVLEPPSDLLKIIYYDTTSGKLPAYLTLDPNDGKKHPAIIWITGGDCNSIGDVWSEAPPSNDQTASGFRKAGIVMMYPSLRGGNKNPGARESFFGEVDDVIAAADFLSKQTFVDPNFIYLGGHSTGGTLVLLTAELSNKFRAVFSFGPNHDITKYDPKYITFDIKSSKEKSLRSPANWLSSIKTPVFVFEGAIGGNQSSINFLKSSTRNSLIQFYLIKKADHFSVLFPKIEILAKKILLDNGSKCNIKFSKKELAHPSTK